MSIGTLIQRQRCAATPLLWGSAIQYASSAIALASCRAVGPDQLSFTEHDLVAGVVDWCALDCCVLTMLWLLQHRAAASVSSCSSSCRRCPLSEAAVLFDEQLNVTTVAGFATAIVGVALVTRTASRTPND